MKVTQTEKPQLVNNLPNPQRKKPKKAIKLLRINSLKSLTKMYSVNYAKLPSQRTTEPIKPENGKNSEFSNLMRFSTFGLKLLFAKDLLSFFSDLSSKGASNKSPLTHLLVKSGKVTSKVIDSKTSKEKIAAEVKKEFKSVEKLLKTIDNQLPKNEKEIKKLLSQMQKEVRGLNSSLKQMPKIRLQVLYSQILKLKAQLDQLPKAKNSEKSKGAALNKKGSFSIKHAPSNRKVWNQSESKGSFVQNADSKKLLKHLNNLHQSLTQLSKTANEGERASLVSSSREAQHMFTQKSLIPLGIVYPFSNFKFDRSSKKKKKMNWDDLAEDEEYQEEDSSSKNKK